MTNRAPQASQRRPASSEGFRGNNTSPGSAMARSASAHHLSGGTSPSGDFDQGQPSRGSNDPPDSGDSESSYSSDASDSPSPPFGQKKPTGSIPASRQQGLVKSVPSREPRQQPGQYSSGMGSSSSVAQRSPAPGGTRFDSRNSPSSQKNPREQPLPSSSRMSPSPQSPGAAPPKRKSLLQSSRDSAAVLGTAKRISSSNQDQSWSSNQWDRKLSEIQEERSESSASSTAGPGGSQRSGRTGRAGDNDGYSNPSAPSMASMPGTPADVNVRQRLLEQQWAKKPSVARTSLVVALQGRDR